MTARAVITGIGVVAPSGVGAKAHWRSMLNGENCIRQISRFDSSGYSCRLAGEVPDFDPGEHVERRLLVQTDRWTWMSLAAAAEAFEDAAFDPAAADPYSMSVVLASTSGGNEFGQRELQRLWTGAGRSVGAYQSIAWFYAASTGQTSILHQMKGPSGVIATDSAGGLDSLGHARRTIRRGVPLVIAGGTEAPIGPYALACQLRSGRLSSRDDPAHAYRPFDRDSTGWVPGEGGATLVVEDLDRVAARHGAARVEIVGYGATHDAHHHSRSAPHGRQLARAMRLALADARMQAGEVDVVFADASGVPEEDAIEARGIREVFGLHTADTLVTAPKSLVGRLYSGGSALDVATAVLAVRDGWVPVVGNLENPADGCDLNFVTGQARRADVRVAMVNARGFGGFNSSLLLRRIDGSGTA